MCLLYVHSLYLCSTHFLHFSLLDPSFFKKKAFLSIFIFSRPSCFLLVSFFNFSQCRLQNIFDFSSPFLFRFFCLFWILFNRKNTSFLVTKISFSNFPKLFLCKFLVVFLQKYQNYLSIFCHLHFSERWEKICFHFCFESANLKICSPLNVNVLPVLMDYLILCAARLAVSVQNSCSLPTRQCCVVSLSLGHLCGVPMISGRFNFQSFLGPRQRDTDFLFVPGSWRIRVAYPSRHLLHDFGAVRACRSIDHLNISSSRVNW